MVTLIVVFFSLYLTIGAFSWIGPTESGDIRGWEIAACFLIWPKMFFRGLVELWRKI